MAGVEVDLLEDLYSLDVPRRGQPPGGDLRLVGYEVVVQVAGEEAGRSRLLADDAKDVVAVPGTGLAQEGLFTFVVVGGVEAEDPGAAAMGEGRV